MTSENSKEDTNDKTTEEVINITFIHSNTCTSNHPFQSFHPLFLYLHVLYMYMYTHVYKCIHPNLFFSSTV